MPRTSQSLDPNPRNRFLLLGGLALVLLALLVLPSVLVNTSARGNQGKVEKARPPQTGPRTNAVEVAPSNDTCAGAIPLTVARAVNGDLSGATNDYQLSGAGCFSGIGQTASTMAGSDVVYSFTAPVAGNYSIKLTDYSGAGDLGLYFATSCPSATPGTPVTVASCLGASNRNVNGASEELFSEFLSAGQQTFIFVDNANAASPYTTFKIEVTSCQVETPTNDTPGTANTYVFGIEGSLFTSPAVPDGIISDVDFFSLGTPAAGSRVFALLDGSASNPGAAQIAQPNLPEGGGAGDFVMRVTTTTDTLQFSDDDADYPFDSLASVIAGTPLTGVASFLSVSAFNASDQLQPYRLYAIVEPPGAHVLPGCGASTSSSVTEIEPNDTIAQANSSNNTSAGGYFDGSFNISTDVDKFFFTAKTGDLIFIAVDSDPCRNSTPTNALLRLLDSTGAQLLSVNGSGSISSTTSGAGSLTATTPNSPGEALVYRIQANGTYYAEVSVSAGGKLPVFPDGGPFGRYLLTISRNGNPAVGPTDSPGTISGRIADAAGAAVAGAVINLSGAQTRTAITDSNGEYDFADVTTGGFYTVTPTRANYLFNPINRAFSLIGNSVDADFAATFGGDYANPVDTNEYFVRQQYLDFLGREPDQGGLEFWSAQINQCGADSTCIANRRIDVSAAFFMSGEFQQSGSYIYDLYAGVLGRTPGFAEFIPDRAQVIGGSGLDAAKTAFAGEFAQRPEFVAKYPATMTREQFVDAVLLTIEQRSGVDLSSARAGLLTDYDNGGRGLVARHAAEAGQFVSAEYNKAFVLMEYFGYLQRGEDPGGYDFWLNALNQGGANNYRGMVCSFLTSTEYQHRFATVVTHGNGECE